MNIQATIDFLNFFGNIDYLIIIMVRCFGFFMIMPVFSGASIPNQIKIALALFMAYMIYSTGTISGLVYDPSSLGYFYLILIEFLTGFVLAFAVYIVFNAFFIAGRIIDFQIGFSMVSVLDPITQVQVPITGNLMYMVIMFMLIQTGGLHDVIFAFVKSYSVIPIGGAAILSNEAFLNTAIASLVQFYILGLRIAMPVLGIILVFDVVLGVLVKAVPSMNIFVVGMPMKMFLGLFIFFVTVPAFYAVFDTVFLEAFNTMFDFMEALVA